MRRSLLVAGLSVALGVLVTPPAIACACGGFAPPTGASVEAYNERAIVSWHNGQERIELSMGVNSSVPESGLIIPTPSPAQVDLGKVETFAAIEVAIAPRTFFRTSWWGEWGFGRVSGSTGGGAGTAGAGGTMVLSDVQLGPFRAATLQAADAASLDTWLAQNGYQLRAELKPLVKGYVDRGWYFVALKLAENQPLRGDLAPIQLTFNSPELVYPLDLSRAAALSQRVRLYVVDQHRVEPRLHDGGGALIGEWYTAWAAPAPAVVADRGQWLTVIDVLLNVPALDARDLALVRSSSDTEVTPPDLVVTRVVYFLGLPVGWTVLLGTVVGLIGYRVVRYLLRERAYKRQYG